MSHNPVPKPWKSSLIGPIQILLICLKFSASFNWIRSYPPKVIQMRQQNFSPSTTMIIRLIGRHSVAPNFDTIENQRTVKEKERCKSNRTTMKARWQMLKKSWFFSFSCKGHHKKHLSTSLSFESLLSSYFLSAKDENQDGLTSTTSSCMVPPILHTEIHT